MVSRSDLFGVGGAIADEQSADRLTLLKTLLVRLMNDPS